MRLASVVACLLLLVVVALPARAVEVTRVVSPGGIEAWLIEDHTNPIIALDLAFRGGGAVDPVDKEGLATLLAGTLDEGAGELDSQAFQARLQDLSIRLSFDSGMDSFQGSLRTLTENRDTAFDLLRLALSEPRFDDEPVERIRSQILAGLQRKSEDPDTIAGRTLRQMLFPGHPYSRPTDGTPESLARITAADLRRFVAERLARDTLKVGVVGDITAAELAPLLDSTFGGLPAEAKPIAVPDVAAAAEGGVVVIEKAVPQSVVALGQPGIKRDDPDFYAAYVVNYILGGGGFASRLYKEVREKRGLAYSVYAYLSPLEHSAIVSGGVATANARVAESLALIRQEWARMAEEGPTAEELENAKTYLTGSYPLRLSSSSRIAGMLVGIQLDELGIDYINRRNDFIEAVTLEDARRVARKLYNADALSVVVVGQPEGITPTRPAPDGAS
ncbi:MAG: M16 family metallopeptidase [Kiloniellales bacterium]